LPASVFITATHLVEHSSVMTNDYDEVAFLRSQLYVVEYTA